MLCIFRVISTYTSDNNKFLLLFTSVSAADLWDDSSQVCASSAELSTKFCLKNLLLVMCEASWHSNSAMSFLEWAVRKKSV